MSANNTAIPDPEINLTIRPGQPDFLDLPWDKPLLQWTDHCKRLEELPRGLSRHSVVFVNYDGVIFAIKELPPGVAENEYQALTRIEVLALPGVLPVAFGQIRSATQANSLLITHFLDRSIPYRSLFMANDLSRYRKFLLDAMASLLVQLHLAGVFWGDCSLSNTLFRRDAGMLQAYLVDAETAELYPKQVPPALRLQDLEIMEENITGDLADLRATGLLAEGVPVADTGSNIRRQYQSLWEEATHEDIINPGENFRIQERIRALNNLGFSVANINLNETENGNKLRLKVIVSDRNFHRNQLFNLTGLAAEERQARKIMNEIQEVKATLSQTNRRSTPLSAAAYYWLEHIFQPTLNQLKPALHSKADQIELYCQILEHKWYLSERAQRDVGHIYAADDFVRSFPDILQ